MGFSTNLCKGRGPDPEPVIPRLIKWEAWISLRRTLQHQLYRHAEQGTEIMPNPNCVCVKALLARAVKNMFFILMNRSECGGKFSEIRPCHDLSCECRDQWQVGLRRDADGTAKRAPAW